MISVSHYLTKLMAVLGFAIAALTMVAAQAYAIEAPRLFVERMVDRTIATLEETEADPSARQQALGSLLQESFDLKRIGRLALGKHYRVAAEQDRAAYHALFGDYLVATYAERLNSAFKGSQKAGLEVRFGEVQIAKKDRIVPSMVYAGESRIELNWRVRERDGAWQIIDVVVEGISMVITQRNEFNAIVGRSNQGLAALNAHLQEKINANASLVLASEANS